MQIYIHFYRNLEKMENFVFKTIQSIFIHNYVNDIEIEDWKGANSRNVSHIQQTFRVISISYQRLLIKDHIQLSCNAEKTFFFKTSYTQQSSTESIQTARPPQLQPQTQYWLSMSYTPLSPLFLYSLTSIMKYVLYPYKFNSLKNIYKPITKDSLIFSFLHRFVQLQTTDTSYPQQVQQYRRDSPLQLISIHEPLTIRLLYTAPPPRSAH